MRYVQLRIVISEWVYLGDLGAWHLLESYGETACGIELDLPHSDIYEASYEFGSVRGRLCRDCLAELGGRNES